MDNDFGPEDPTDENKYPVTAVTDPLALILRIADNAYQFVREFDHDSLCERKIFVIGGLFLMAVVFFAIGLRLSTKPAIDVKGKLNEIKKNT